MPVYRFPILIWQDCSGQYTAALVEDDHAAVGATRHAALRELHDFLEWRCEKQSGWLEPDFQDPQLVSFKVPVRPEYRNEEHVFPCDDQIALRVHCVHGRQQGGLNVASLPLFGIRFYYYEADSLRDLATRYVQQKLQGLTPQQISRFLPPPAVSLDETVVRISRASRPRGTGCDLPILSTVAEPVGHRSVRKQFGRPWERDAELAELVGRLRKPTGNVLVVGEAGSGKTTLLAAAVAAVEKEAKQKKESPADDGSAGPLHRFWATSGARLIAGMKYLGEWEQRCEELVGELASIGGVLCIENLLDLIRIGGCEASASVAAFLATYMQRGEIRMLAEAMPSELEACRRLLPGLADLFQIVVLPDFDRPRALRVLERVAAQWKQNRRLEFDRGVLENVYYLFRRFYPYQSFPGKVVSFVSQLAEDVLRRNRAEDSPDLVARPGGIVCQDDAIALFVRQTGLPELFLRDELLLDFDAARESFERQIIGLKVACRAAANLATTFKAGLNDPARPVAVLLFCGPTGVGKTELARAVSRYFFCHGERNDDRLVRLDMSEYGGFGAAQRLVESSDGNPSELINRLRAQPFAVVLFDEIEKAAPEVFDMLLTLFDEGRLTDRYGRTTSFRSAILILTSNLGSEQQGSIGFGPPREGAFEAAVQGFFRPEFFNRIDAVVTFDPLDRETIRRITRKDLEEIGRREGLAEKRIRVAWSDALVERLAEEGCDPRYGARPLQRTIERRVIAPLARFLLSQPEVSGRLLLADIDADGQAIFTWSATET